MTWKGARQLTALALLLPAYAQAPARVTGPIPERATREFDYARAGRPRPRGQEVAEHEEKRHADSEERVDPAMVRIGVASTHVFHRSICAELKDVPTSDQIRFTTPWESLD